ncbi:MAG: patatin family protein, partial [Methylococcaceae bacterium]|nr:patatin family protein [Methylococcaceae bacterium]
TKDFPAFSGPAITSDEQSDGQIYLLSSIRTDLDAFSDIEANALMYDGYCLCDRFINQSAGLNAAPAGKWKFLNIRSVITDEPAKLIKHLNVASDLFFKVFRLIGLKGRILGGILILVALSILWWLLTELITYIRTTFESPSLLAGILVLGLAAWFLLKRLPKRFRAIKKLADAIRKIRTGKVMGAIYVFAIITSVGSAIAYFHLKVVNPIYLKLGK